MKAVVLHEYGGPSKLKLEEVEDPKPGEGQVLVHVSAASVNPVDWKMRSGAAKERFPVEFPGILGRDVAGVVRELGPGVKGFEPADRVMALADHTYAELCVIPAEFLCKVPERLEMTVASTVPLVALTGDQLIREACNVQPGQTVLITGALGSVGRCAVYAAKEIGATVIAGVRKNQKHEAERLPGVHSAVDIDDDDAVSALGWLDAVADAVGGKVATRLLPKVKQGGVFGSLVGPPEGAELHTTIQIKPMTAHPNPVTVAHYAEAVRDGKLEIPMDEVLPLRDAGEAQARGEKGGVGKIVLVPGEE